MVGVRLKDFLEEAAAAVNRELAAFFPKKITAKWISSSLGRPEHGLDLNAAQAAISDPIWDFLSRGGKRWRPALMLLACGAVGGSRKRALPYTVIPELTHNGTIMIDDIEDGSNLRRGKPSTHILFGVDVAVNAGNAMYYIPTAVLSSGKRLPDRARCLVYELYCDSMLRLSFGQAMDIHWHKGGSNVSESQYLQMCAYKTGSLARLSAELGAVIGGASPQQVSALGRFAESIGVAFQIQDDILNLKPETIEWGKEVGEDIKEGKRSLMVIHALSSLGAQKKNRLLGILNAKEKSDADVAEAISIIESAGSIDYAAKVARGLVSRSWKALDGKIPASEAKSLLKEFADYLVDRSK